MPELGQRPSRWRVRELVFARKVLVAIVIVAIVAIASVALLWFLARSDGSGGDIGNIRSTSAGTERTSVVGDSAAIRRQVGPTRSEDTDATAMVARLSAASWSPHPAAIAIQNGRRRVIGPTKRNDLYDWYHRPTSDGDGQDETDGGAFGTRQDDVYVNSRTTNRYDSQPIAGTADDWNGGPPPPPSPNNGHRDPYDLTAADDYGFTDDINKQLTDGDNRPTVVGGSDRPDAAGTGSESYYSTLYGPYPAPSAAAGSSPTTADDSRPLTASYYQPPGYQPPGYQPSGYQPSGYQPPDYRPPSYRPSNHRGRPPVAAGPQQKIAVPVVPPPPPTKSAFDWKLIAVVALAKLAAVKLKALAAVGALAFALFNVKLLLVAALFKSALLLKLVKLLALPSIALPLLTAAVALFSPVARILRSLFAAPAAVLPGFTGTLSAGQPSSIAPGGGGVLVPGRPGGSTSVPGRPGGGNLVPGRPGQSVPGSAFKQDDSGTPSYARRRDYESSSSSRAPDPTLDVFRELLDSERCVQRIACRMAAAESAGVLPSWINWVLRGTSKVIPNEKLAAYFKTYNDVSNELLSANSSSRADDGWTTRCSERYDCNHNIDA